MTYHRLRFVAVENVPNARLTKPFRLADLTPVQERILLALRGSSKTKPVTAGQLAAAIYADRADGGPEWARSVINVRASDLRRRLRGTPVALCSRRGPDGGYWLGGAAAL